MGEIKKYGEASLTTKLTFFDAAAAVAELARKIEDGEEIDEALIAEFGSTSEQLAASIDRRKYVVAELKSKIAMVKEHRDKINKFIKRLENMKKRLNYLTAKVIENEPDIPYKDSLGRRVYLQKTQKLRVGLEITSKSFDNILDGEKVDLLEVDPKYIVEVSFYRLNTELLKEDLLAGTEVSFAALETRIHVRGL